MIHNKDICRELAAKKATIILEDGFKEDGTPNLTIRRVTGAGGMKLGRDSYWYVNFDGSLTSDCVDCTGVAYSFVLGYYMGDKGNVAQLIRRINAYSHLTAEQKTWLIADATTRMTCSVCIETMTDNEFVII